MEEKETTILAPDSAGSTRSWPKTSSRGFLTSGQKKKRFLKRRIVFDHLWGIPGGLSKQDLAILRYLETKNASSTDLSPQEHGTYLVLDQADIAENRDACCNHAYGRTAREWAWHTSLHGYKYLVFQRHGLCQRICWGLLCILALVLGVLLSICIIFYYLEDPVFLTVQKVGLDDHEVSLPSITVCPGNLKQRETPSTKKAHIEARLRPMRDMWPIWEGITNELFDPDRPNGSANLAWSNDTRAIHDLMHQIMIEGGLMSMPSCEESILNCSLGTPRECCRNSRLILTKNGPCYRLKWSGPDKREDRSIDNSLGFYVKQARHDLNLSITLSGTSSSRVGYPIMNAKYFGKGYLCPENWGDTEAGVMCRSLGFSGGERFFMDGAPTFGPSNIFGLRIQCKGHEESLLECESDYRDLSGNTLSQCEIQTPVAIICDQGAIELEANRNIRTRGLAFIKAKPNRSADPEESYFCADSFSNKEALVFCKMLSWEFGKAISLPYSNLTTYSYLHGISCGSKSEEPHILGCSKYGNGSTPCTKGPAAVECSPGYPFTLRLLTGPMGRNMPPEAELAVGYPVIDTPSSPGFICDRHLNDEVVGMICKALGFKFGRKLPSGLYGHPQVGKDLLFVLEKLACSGNERSIFECQIGPWGAHKCDEAEILSLACANDKSKFDFEPVIVNQDSLEALGSNQNGFVGIQTSLGIIPGCQGTQTNGARLWGDREANALCLEKEFECGMLNRTTDRLERVLGHDGFLQDVFARFNCSGKHEELTSLMSCQPRLSSTCPSRETGSTICLYRSHPDFELCKLLQTEFQGRDMTSSSYLLQRDRTLHLEIAFQNETKTGTEIQGSCKNSTISSSPIKVFVGDLGEAGKGNMVALERRSRTDIQVSAKLIDTTEQVMREWTWESDRWCRNGDLNYSRKDCSLQCQASLAMAVCDCLPWSLSRTPLPENGLSTICTGASILCLRKIETTLEVAARNITLAERILRGQELNINGLGNVRDRCRCPPPCQGVVQYHVESTTFRGSQGTCGNEGENGNAWFHLYLDRTASISYLRRTKLPWELLLALVGGVMTLFCGFSLISILEWVYFHTIRWWHNAHDPMVSDGNYKPLEDGLEGQDPIRRSYSDPELGPKVHFKDEPITNGASRQSTGLRRRNQSRTTTAISRKSVPPPSRNLSLTSVKNSKSRVSTAANTSARSKPLRTRSVKSTTSRRTIDHNGMPPLDGM